MPPLVVVVTLLACIVWWYHKIQEAFLQQLGLEVLAAAGQLPLSMQMTAANKQPEHWEHSSVQGFDQAYRNMSNLINYENAAFQEAGWKPTTESVSESGPNVTSMVISLVLLTFACFSFLVLIMLM